MKGTRLATALLLLPALGAMLGPEIPWPGGTAPTPEQIQASAEAAGATWEEDRLVEFRSAQEDQVDAEIKLIGQDAIDDHTFDLETSRIYGHRLFEVGWRRDMGWGTASADQMRPVHSGEEPGTDAQSCDGCHMVGGQDGGGSFAQSALLRGDGDRESNATRRNPPAMLGLGLVQALAAEMSAELKAQRDRAMETARRREAEISVTLVSKGVSFGILRARPEGGIDTSKIEGVSADLVIRPFGWKGSEATIRRFVEDAARTHLGVESALGVTANDDPDADGVARELEEGSLTMLSVYVALLEVPVVLPPASPALQARWASGSALFDSVGCAGCHRRSLLLEDRMASEGGDTTRGPPLTFNLLKEGDAPRGTDQVMLFSDLKRHAIGPELAERGPDPDGVAADVFLTRPLWGVAETPPYLHDGRAATLPEAILAHGGEAQQARTAYAALSSEKKADLQVFLLSLSRTPRLRVAR